MSAFEERLADKRGKVLVSRRVVGNIDSLRSLSDRELRLRNFSSMSSLSPTDRVVFDNGLTLSDVYRFAVEHYEKSDVNLLDVPLDGDHPEGLTLLWSSYCLAERVFERTLSESQYLCASEVSDLMLSGDFDDYRSVRYVRHMMGEVSPAA